MTVKKLQKRNNNEQAYQTVKTLIQGESSPLKGGEMR